MCTFKTIHCNTQSHLCATHSTVHAYAMTCYCTVFDTSKQTTRTREVTNTRATNTNWARILCSHEISFIYHHGSRDNNFKNFMHMCLSNCDPRYCSKIRSKRPSGRRIHPALESLFLFRSLSMEVNENRVEL